jgi:hypothetical protein
MGELPFAPQDVGSHWSRDVHVDVAAVNWSERAILLGECKWGVDAVDRATVRELIEAKAPKVVKVLPAEGAGWSVFYALFARSEFTDAARVEAERVGPWLVDVTAVDAALKPALFKD